MRTKGLSVAGRADCASCHPEAKVGESIHETLACLDCHPGMPERIATAKIHRDIGSKSSGAPYYVQKVLFWLVIVSAVVTLLWFIPVLVQRARRRARP